MAHVRRVRWLVPLVMLGLVAILLGLVYVAPPVYRAKKRLRAERAAMVGAAAIERQDWREASNNLLLALNLAPESPAVLHQAARFTTLIGKDSAFQYWQMYFDHATPTRDDRLMYLGLVSRLGRADLMKPHLVALLQKDAHDPEALELCIGAFTQMGNPESALDTARELATQHPNREGVDFLLAKALIAVGKKGGRNEARRLLWSLAFRPRPDAFAALGELSRMPEVSTNELRLLLHRVPSIQTNSLFRLLAEFNLRMRLDPALDRSAAARDVVETLPSDAPLTERLLALDWLLANNQGAKALQISGPPWSQTNEFVLQRHLTALGSLDRWNEVTRLIEDDESPVTPINRHLYRAVSATHGNHPDEAAVHLLSATTVANARPEDLLMIAAYAEALDQPAIAATALQPLLSNPVLVPSTGPRILQLLDRVDSIRPMLLAVDRLLTMDPGKDSLRNDQLWLRILSDDRVEESTEAATELLGKHPDEPRFLATVALGRIRMDDPEKALELLESHPVHGTNYPIRLQLVHAAAMGASGRREAARQLARAIPMVGLRSEERVLVREWLEKSKQQ